MLKLLGVISAFAILVLLCFPSVEADNVKTIEKLYARNREAEWELQLHHRKIAAVNNYLGHYLYEFVRSNDRTSS